MWVNWGKLMELIALIMLIVETAPKEAQHLHAGTITLFKVHLRNAKAKYGRIEPQIGS